jgi:hypothetical protein
LKFGCLRELYGEGKTSLTRIARASEQERRWIPVTFLMTRSASPSILPSANIVSSSYGADSEVFAIH